MNAILGSGLRFLTKRYIPSPVRKKYDIAARFIARLIFLKIRIYKKFKSKI